MEELISPKLQFVTCDRINPRVAEILLELTNELSSLYHPKSIIISGSFGKGEATVKEHNGKIEFLSDCELILVPPYHIFKTKQTKALCDKMRKKYGLDVDLSGVSHSIYLLFPHMNTRIKPTMANYDLKYGSKTICGKDYLRRIPAFSQKDIPCWEGIRLLLNRMVESTNYFSLIDPKANMIFWTDKIVLACQDALLIFLGKYNESYRKRNILFKETFESDIYTLYSEIPQLLDMVRDATRRKLDGDYDLADPISHWFNAAEICDKVFRYILKEKYGFNFRDYIEFQNVYLRTLELSIWEKLFYNAKKNIKAILLYKQVKYINFITPFNHIIYSLIPLYYFNLSRDLTINLSYINYIRSFINPFVSIEKPIVDTDYNYKDEFINLWKVFC